MRHSAKLKRYLHAFVLIESTLDEHSSTILGKLEKISKHNFEETKLTSWKGTEKYHCKDDLDTKMNCSSTLPSFATRF